MSFGTRTLPPRSVNDRASRVILPVTFPEREVYDRKYRNDSESSNGAKWERLSEGPAISSQTPRAPGVHLDQIFLAVVQRRSDGACRC